MDLLLKTLKKFLFIFTAVMAGICTFTVFAVFNVDRTILNSNFHKELFVKNDIYSKTESVINTSMTGFINDLKKNSTGDFKQYNEVFSILQKSMTPEMIRFNLDSLREGLFQYFKGERSFLPDIYLNGQKQINDDKKAVEEKNASSSSALTKIDKINLSAILLYINRSDITDFLFIIKFLYFLVGVIPGFSLLLFLLFSLIGLIICIKPIHVIRWIIVFLSTCSLLSIVSGFYLIIFNYYIIPSYIFPVTMSVPLQSDVILAYIHNCIMPVSVSLLIIGIFLFILALITFHLPKRLPTLFVKEAVVSTKNSQRLLKNSVYVIICLLAVSSIVYKYDFAKKSFDDNNFSIALSKLKNVNTVTEVIPAKNEAIYGLNIKLIDSKTKVPISNTSLNISGKSSLLKKVFNDSSTTDASGIAKFKLDKGTFRITFFQNNFPIGYQIPSPFFFDLKSAGTTIITINLQTIPVDAKEKWGISEIELLDKNNMPIPNIELSTQAPFFAPGFPYDTPSYTAPDNIYSYTNSEGIAVFKLNEGNYKINFVNAKFPLMYKMPPPIEINVSYNTLNRYTIRLVDSK